MDSAPRMFRGIVDDFSPGAAEPDELRDRLAAAHARGCAAHPQLLVSPEAFARHLVAVIGNDPISAIDSLAIEDLYFACACVTRAAGAERRFENRLASVIEKAVARVMTGRLDRDEAVQLCRRDLLMGTDGSPPKLAKYGGRGPLENWVSVIAIRTAVSFGRAEGAWRGLRDRAARETMGALDPELLFMKDEVQREVAVAFEQALQRLEARDRLALRLHVVSGMTLEEIGKCLGIAHQTVSRLLVRARKRILSDIRRQLGERLQASKADLASIARLVASQIDLSLSRLLGAR
jgi:RNA polymerase sigma-70 factor (ECF subfamily)